MISRVKMPLVNYHRKLLPFFFTNSVKINSCNHVRYNFNSPPENADIKNDIKKICKDILQKKVETAITEINQKGNMTTAEAAATNCGTSDSGATPKTENDPCGLNKKTQKNPVASGACSAGGMGGGTGKSDKVVYCEGRNGRRRTWLFSKDTIMMNYEILPILAIKLFAVGFLIFMVGWISQTRDDVRYRKYMNYETLDLLNPPKRKLLIINQPYKPMTELDSIYKGMASGQPTGVTKTKRKSGGDGKYPECKFF